MKNDIEKMKMTIEKSHNRKSLESQYLEMKQITIKVLKLGFGGYKIDKT